MKLLNKTLRTFEFESILIKKSKSRPKNLLNFKYIPQQLVNDTIEVVKSKSDLVGTYSGFSSINIDIEKLKELGSQDKTLTEIADIWGFQ